MATSTTAQALNLALSERMDRGFTELKTMLQGFDERLRGLETREAGCQPIVQARIDAAWKRLDQHDKELQTLLTLHQTLTQGQVNLTNQVRNLQGVLRWILGVFTGILLAVLSAFATGQATIVFK